jgi:hypothetical protein
MNEDDKRQIQEEAFRSDLGHKATVERWDSKNEGNFNANWELQKIGQSLKAGHTELREHEYLGSMAVHVYMTPKMQVPIFISQTPLGKSSEVLASTALTNLKGDAMEFFGKARQTKRSGF